MPITSYQRIPRERVCDLVPSFFLAHVLEPEHYKDSALPLPHR